MRILMKTLTSFINLVWRLFKKAEAEQDIQWPNLPECLSTVALGDQELGQFLPDMEPMELWVVSDSALCFYNYEGCP